MSKKQRGSLGGTYRTRLIDLHGRNLGDPVTPAQHSRYKEAAPTMSTHPTLEVESTSTQNTLEIGQQLGAILREGDVVGLIGELGAGKTWLAKGIAAGLGVPGHEYVNSPAYDIIHEYSGRVPVYHMDFYRIDDIGTDEYLWLEEYFPSTGVCIAEWADKFLSEIANESINIHVSWDSDTDHRRFLIESVNLRGSEIVKALEKSLDADSNS